MHREIMEIAMREYGLKEIVGGKHEPRIVQMFKDIKQEWVKDDETAWCACFVNWVLMQVGITGTGKLNARSFLDFGEATKKPIIGDIVVFWRGIKTGALGHVGFYIGQRNGLIYVLGGNQGDQVSISGYDETRLLGFRKCPTSPFSSMNDSIVVNGEITTLQGQNRALTASLTSMQSQTSSIKEAITNLYNIIKLWK